MREAFNEQPKNFKEFISLGLKMSPQEAIGILSAFHKASSENVLAAFMNLRGFAEGTVEFREGINNGHSCIVIEGRNKEGKFAWNHLIDEYTGKPQSRTS